MLLSGVGVLIMDEDWSVGMNREGGGGMGGVVEEVFGFQDRALYAGSGNDI